ncbi:MAG: Rieske 2Fe-2S domain-containing protein [Methanomassiliicoccales archaeon]|nr:Rieske 2Fe-2S domain-containing protein [Methanomassiliicoccales archaeon]
MRTNVGKTADFEEGRLAGIEVDGRSLVISRYKGALFAMDGWCSHAEYEISKGKFMDGVVTCPLHGPEFDIRTRKKLAHNGAKALMIYPIWGE